MSPIATWSRRLVSLLRDLRPPIVDGLRGRWLATGVVTGLAFAAAATQAGFIGTVYAFFNALGEDAGELTLLGLHIPVERTRTTVIAFGVLMGGLVAAGSLCRYASQAMARRMARRSYHDAISGFMGRVGRTPRLAAGDDAIKPSEIQIHVVRNLRHAGLAVENVIHAAMPLLNLATALVIAVMIEPAIALIPLVVMLIAPIFVARLVFGIQSNARAFYSETNRAAAQLVRDRVRRFERAELGDPGRGRLDVLSDDPVFTTFFDSFDRNLLATHRVALATGLARATVMAAVLSVAGAMILGGTTTTGSLVAIIVALFAAMNAAQQLAGLATNLIRFHPQIAAGHAMEARIARLTAVETADAADAADAAVGAATAGAKADAPGSGRTPAKAAATPILVHMPDRLDRTQLGPLVDALAAAGDLPVATWPVHFVSSPQPETDGVLDLAREVADPDRVQDVAGVIGVSVGGGAAAGDDAGGHASADPNVARDVTRAWLIGALASRPAAARAIDADLLAGFPPETVLGLTALLADAPLIVVTHRDDPIPGLGEPARSLAGTSLVPFAARTAGGLETELAAAEEDDLLDL